MSELLWLSAGWFWALPLVPVVLLAPRWVRGAREAERRDLVHHALRALALLAVVAALARPARLGDDEPTRRALVLDVAPSVDPADGARAVEACAAALEAYGDDAFVVGLGSRPDALADDPRVHWLASPRADLGDALTAALERVPAGAPARLSVWTDGALRGRDLGGALEACQLRGLAVDVVPLAERSDDLALVDVWAPEPLRVGESGLLRARLRGTGRVDLELEVGGEPWAAAAGLVVDGTLDVELVVEPSAPGFPVATATLRVLEGENALPANDALERTLAVQDPLRAVVFAERLAGSVEELDRLVGAGVQLSAGDPEAPDLTDHDLVVLDDVRAERLSPARQEELVTAVAERGLGLVVAGGEAAFGPGGYHDTALDAILPVESVQKEEKRDPSTTLVVIIDTSGSMGGNRVQLAKEVARLAIRRLLPHDKVGIVEFYGAKRWAAPIQPASNSIEIQRALNRLDAGGGTVILPAIEEAFYGLQNVETRYKHVLVLTDGGVETGPFESLVRRMAEKGINVSTVLVGPDSHSEFLVNIANWGKGRFYSVANRFNLPEVLLKQPTSARIPAWRPGSHAVRGRGGRGWWGEVDPTTLPPLDGYTETKARPGAEVLVETARGTHPVVATWQYGLGRVATVTTELTGLATDGWDAWDGYGAFLGRVFARSAPRDGGPFAFHLERRGHEVVLRATRVVRGELVPRAVRVDGDAEVALPFVERAPGRFEAHSVVAPEAPVRVECGVDLERRRLRLALDAHSDLARETATDPAASLDPARLAEATGGELLAVGSPLPAAGTGGTRPRTLRDLRPWFLALALLAYLADVAWRRRPRSSIRPARSARTT